MSRVPRHRAVKLRRSGLHSPDNHSPDFKPSRRNEVRGMIVRGMEAPSFMADLVRLPWVMVRQMCSPEPGVRHGLRPMDCAGRATAATALSSARGGHAIRSSPRVRKRCRALLATAVQISPAPATPPRRSGLFPPRGRSYGAKKFLRDVILQRCRPSGADVRLPRASAVAERHWKLASYEVAGHAPRQTPRPEGTPDSAVPSGRCPWPPPTRHLVPG